MNVRVSGRNVAVRDEVRAALDTKLEHLSHIVSGMDTAEAVFREEQNPRQASHRFTVEITMAGHGHHVRCTADGPDPMTAVDKSCDKLGKQLRKLKTKLDRRARGNPKRNGRPEPLPADEIEEMENGSSAPSHRIVKTKSFELSRMVPEEAIERMHLLEHDWFLFTSEETGRPCVVYVRDDGDIGLINADA